MVEERLHGMLIWAVLAMAPVTFLYLLRRAAPYGRPLRGCGLVATRFRQARMDHHGAAGTCALPSSSISTARARSRSCRCCSWSCGRATI